MKIIFVSNFFNYHQQALSDELFHRCEGNFVFFATGEMSEDRKEMGWKETNPSYLKKIDLSDRKQVKMASIEIADADLVISGGYNSALLSRRKKNKSITFLYSERFNKIKPSILKQIYHWFLLGKYRSFKNLFLLAASAFAAKDYNELNTFVGKSYKWGYFPKTIQYGDINTLFAKKKKNIELKRLDVSILWVARLIELKHPESTIAVAKMLEKEGIKYEINIAGSGPLEKKLKESIIANGLSDNIHLLGAMPPESVREQMEKSDIFLFTSDQNEGWGVTLNESMNSACAVVASNEIGSVPYLIDNGINGYKFQSKNWDDLCKKVFELAKNPTLREKFGKAAYYTIIETWNAKVAVNNLLHLYVCLLNKQNNNIKSGPASNI